MNETVIAFMKEQLKETLAQCNDKQQLLFKRMYAKGKLELPINEVVDGMEVDKMDWAMQQVKRTIERGKQ